MKAYSNKQCHHALTLLHNLFDDFNANKLRTYNEIFLGILHEEAKDCFYVIKFLYVTRQCEETAQYMNFCRQLLLRISSLRHLGRVETDKERAENWQQFNDKHKISDVIQIH